jgi:hypothetical protein
MSFPTNMLKELRERKLWPVAVVLIVALVAVPVLLSKNASTNLVTPPAGAGLPYSTGTTLPAISVETAQANSKLSGKGRNPFTPQHGTATTTTATVTSASVVGARVGSGSPSTGTSSTPSTGATTSAGGTSTASSPTSSGTSTPAPPAPAPSKPAAPSALTSTESYHVSLAITTSDGGVNTIDPLERLSVLPSPQKPLLVELGVLQGGRQVLFAVEKGAAVSGPGTCTPGPIDCEVLSLSPGQVEAVLSQTPTGTTPVSQFSVDAIAVDHHPSVAAAGAARRAASDAGRQLLSQSPLSAVSLFQYDPSVGAVVDLRNLTVGGS